MRAVVITRHGSYDALAVQERRDPPVGPGEVRIAVEAAGTTLSAVCGDLVRQAIDRKH